MKAKKGKSAKRLPVTRERALQVALKTADEEGLESVTMRRLAEDLGIEAMSLYHHVKNKDEILDGMVDLVFGEIDLPRGEDGWRAGMERRARSARAVLRRHPWAISLMESRASPGAANLKHHDAVLGCLRRGGLSVVLAAHAYAVLDSYVYGFAHTEQALPFETTEETQAMAKAIFDQLPAGAFPHLVELTKEHVLKPGYSYGHEFEFGLGLILDGLHSRLERTDARG